MGIATVNFMTKTLGHPVTINVAFPTDKMVLANKPVPKHKPMKTLYFMEGLTGNYNGVLGYTHVMGLAEQFNICIVMIGGDNKWYANSTITGERYGDLITNDLVRFTRETFHLSHEREDTFIGGFSMGGFGAITCGLRHPELFSKIVLLDAALHKKLFMSSTNDGKGDFLNKRQYETIFGLEDISQFEGCDSDYEYLAGKVAESGVEKPEIYMCLAELGTLHKVNLPFKELLEGLGYSVKQEWVHYGHSVLCVGAALEMALRNFLPVEDFGTNMPIIDPEFHFSKEEMTFWDAYYNVGR